MIAKYRVGHVGTGYTGSIALRHVLRSPRLELVGQLAHSPDKAGHDSGELVGEPAVGVVATDSLDDFLALDVDCVTYFAAVAGRDSNDVLDQLCAILASGKNIVTPSYHPLFHPPSLDGATREKLRAACREGNSSLFATGIAPGFTTDILAVHAASMTELPATVSIEERIPCGAYRVPGFFAMLGFGRTPQEDADAYPPGAMIATVTPPLRLLAQGLGLSIDEVREHRDVAIADRDYTFDAGKIPAGTIASVRMRFEGIVNGQPRLHFSSIWSMPDEAVEDWPPAIAAGSITRRLTRITVDGNPPVQIDFALNNGELPGSAATAARVVNAIPAVCAAGPGVLSALDLIVTAQAAPRSA
ncbi:MAG: NAD(P)H-dependent amine dehydrogenase family protein [Mycobacterium sp.]